MPVSNDQELAVAVSQASDLIQDIQNYCGRTLREESKVRFPRGMIGTADSYRAKCPGYMTADRASSCAYGFMFLDVLWWLLSRTDIASVGKQMGLKSAIITLGTILEATLRVPGLPLSEVLSTKSASGVRLRLNEAAKRGWISEDQRTILEQLWGRRNNVHIERILTNELDLYRAEHVNEPLHALLVLMSKMRAWDAEQKTLAAIADALNEKDV